ncbi:MAG: hypothetical protein J5732_05790 [Bacteroidaceae bacterium]|nr:hypothetical protein [Bacteroidaceae bacterium]
METGNLSTEKSLQIIKETIERSRNTIARNSGKPLVLWGSLVALTSLVIWVLWSSTGKPVWNLLWFAMSAIGLVITNIITKNREKVPESEVSRTLGVVWMWFGIITTGFYFMLWIVVLAARALEMDLNISVNLSLIISLMMGLCGIISGSVLNIKAVKVSVLVALLVSVPAALLLKGPEQILTFVVLGLLGLVVPGIILMKKSAE